MSAYRSRFPQPQGGQPSNDPRHAVSGRAGGYTLIESVVAIAVIAVGLLGIFQVLVGTVNTNVDSRNRSLAAHFAERRLEAMRNDDFDYVTTTEDNTDADLTRALGPDAKWSMTVNDIDTQLKGVTLTVNWKQQGRDQSVSLYTLSHQGGIAFIPYRYANGAGSLR